jgi:hypothetical protein
MGGHLVANGAFETAAARCMLGCQLLCGEVRVYGMAKPLGYFVLFNKCLELTQPGWDTTRSSGTEDVRFTVMMGTNVQTIA